LDEVDELIRGEPTVNGREPEHRRKNSYTEVRRNKFKKRKHGQVGESFNKKRKRRYVDCK
jgi:hypothetical protein